MNTKTVAYTVFIVFLTLIILFWVYSFAVAVQETIEDTSFQIEQFDQF